jgi:transposase
MTRLGVPGQRRAERALRASGVADVSRTRATASSVPVTRAASRWGEAGSIFGRRSGAARSSPIRVCVFHRQYDGRAAREALGHGGGVKVVLAKLKGLFPRLKSIWADGGYAGQLIEWTRKLGRWVLEIVKRSDHVTGFAVLPKRRIVERMFTWFGRYAA